MRSYLIFIGCLVVGDCATTLDKQPNNIFLSQVLELTEGARADYISCLSRRALPVWQRLERRGSLVALRLFETRRVVRGTAASGDPKWTHLLLAQLNGRNDVEAVTAATHACDSMKGVKVRRQERLRAIPEAVHPRPAERSPRADVQHMVEYIAVAPNEAAQSYYRHSMERVMGPALGEVIQLGALDYVVALETEMVINPRSGG